MSHSETAVKEAAGPKNRPEDTAFKQQRVPSWQPVMSPPCAIGSLGICGAVFIAIGALILVTSDRIQSIEIRYDQGQTCDFSPGARKVPPPGTARTDILNSSSEQWWACPGFPIQFTLTATMRAPVYLYYRIANMNQNHRQYAKSLDVLQLAGQTASVSAGVDCTPIQGLNGFGSLAGSPIVELVNADGSITNVDASAASYNPCGLIAWSMFNDSVVLSQQFADPPTICMTSNYMADGTPTGPSGSCTKDGIAWSTDPGVKYNAPVSAPGVALDYLGWKINPSNATTTGSYDSGWGYYVSNAWYIGEPGHKIPNPQDEDLMVWMRLALLGDFQKLFRVIHTDLTPGTYTFTVFQRFDVSSFQGKKTLVLQTDSWLGGPNYWLGGLYLTVGSVCVVLALAFLVKHRTTPQILAF